MEKLKSITILTIVILIANFQFVKATHVAGADITYEQIGVDSFLVTVNIFEDCGGAATVPNTISVYFKSSCDTIGFGRNFNLVSLNEVSQLCPDELNNSTCNGGTLPGMLQRKFQKIVVLDSCDAWTATWGIANRNPSVNLDPVGNTLFFNVAASINTAITSQNNSPVFNAQPIPYVCANQLTNYSFGVTEQDGDSLVYSFTDPLGGQIGNPLLLDYQLGYTVQQPIPGITIDANTGLLSFTPTVIGNFVVVIKVEEFRNGLLIGYVIRDIQFVVRACANNVLPFLGGEITNLTGNAIQTSPYALEMCEGNTFNFTASFLDQDTGDVLAIISNINNALPGAIITASGTNPLSANITWTANTGAFAQNNSFALTVNDNACPIPGIQVFVYDINIVQSTYISTSNAVICNNTGTQLIANGGTNFTWYDINGNQIIANSSFSCNNCPDPFVNPSISTSYIVESNLNSSCTNRDTILVTVLTATIPIITQVGYNLTTTTGYVSYQWFNNNSAITNQTNNTFTPTSSGDYYVMVVDSNGCQTQSAVYNFVYVGELELASVAEIILMPNPANNFVLLSATNNKNLNGTLKVSSVNGDLMLEKNLVNSNQFKIDIEQWANGMYTLELIRETKSERIKFIKQQ